MGTSSLALTIEPLQASDHEAMRALALRSPDTGIVQFAQDLLVPQQVADRALGDDSETFVARQGEMLAGLAKVSYASIQYEGCVRPAGLLSSLMVYPDYRRRGIAAALASRRLEAVAERLGSDAVALANIQEGNVGSLRAAAKWRTAQTRTFYLTTTPTKPSAAQADPRALTVRLARVGDLEEVARGLGQFYDRADFYRPQSPDSLLEWVAAPDQSSSPRAYLMAVDAQGNIAAGLGLTYGYQFATLKLVRMPFWVRVLNMAVNQLPRDGVLRPASVDLFFHLPGRQDAAISLWEAARSQWRRHAHILILGFDGQGPLGPLQKTLKLTQGTRLTTAVRADIPPDPARPFAPWL